ncbi:hypothetical protein [Pseudalkalibacillus sp. SCS-8]|uniref:hypothetical protein n=1 Tax=Pseudalkalibacillus nanhaiensis TaxID=3115291 RepID=UPI0032DA5CAF
MHKFVQAILAIAILMMIPMDAMAYSYGDPSEEPVAIAYEEIVGYLNDDQIGKAEEVFGTIEEEVRLHMGDEVVKDVEKAFEDEDKETIIEHMQTVLVLNISRRLNAIEEKFDEVDKNKVLLAKANATYKALSPTIQNENAEMDAELKDEFEKALKALGNPGLFGVGEQESDENAFTESKETILEDLKQFFDLESVEVGHYASEGIDEDTSQNTETWTDYAQLKNWLPILILLIIIVGVIVYVRRKR